ncbi:toll-like receptor 4 [Mytilus californianus]|uniref:toll-like receptor 4 n=1 Tax=Mytilus californianus TaxID=6549 RepID=UPI00224744A6|nr:toll-like receptor 4 [Mytilus californianus]
MGLVILCAMLLTTHFRCQTIDQHDTVCSFNSKCRCWTDQHLRHVDCSNANMTDIPNFPPETDILNINSNYIEFLQNDTFENLTNLLELDLSHNKLIRIEANAFIGLGKLEKLSLEANRLNYTEESFDTTVLNPLQSLTLLNVKHQEILNILPGDMIRKLHSLRNLETDLISSTEGIAFGKEFSYLAHLTLLKAGKCKLEMVNNNTFIYLPFLEIIHLSECIITQFGKGCIFCHLNNFKYLDISKVVCDFTSFKFLALDFKETKIKKINMSETFYNTAYPPFHMFDYLKNSGITEIYMNKNVFVGSHTGTTGNIPSTLKILDFSENFLTLVVFQMRDLLTLNLRQNQLGKMLEKGGYKTPGPIALQNVDLSQNGINALLFQVFDGHCNVQTMNLSDNALTDFTPDISEMVKLRFLDLSKNKIKKFSNVMTMQNISRIAKKTNLKIDLSKNILDCSCASFAFIEWMHENHGIFNDIHSYKCKAENGTFMILNRLQHIVSMLKKDCETYTVLIICISLAIVTALLILSGGLLYRYRWRLRYVYYMTRNRYKRYKQIEENNDYKYNAFISYADEEAAFVKNECIPELEGNRNLSLCIHHRDFVAGEDITQNITNGIHDSNKTICIVTQSFLDSYYCMFEFNMAKMESIYSREGQNILFLVFYENIPSKNLPLVMLEVVQQQSYIEYPSDANERVVFWENIKQAIE